ncbi:MAG TPA: hypothetical protein VM694_39480 [Polyangium sp.]|nr:hypothetical protein [Polyangium sp.]
MSGPARLDLEFPERVRVRLEELRAMNGADSLTEVVRRALAAYDVLLTAARERGDKIVLRSHDGTEREMVIP